MGQQGFRNPKSICTGTEEPTGRAIREVYTKHKEFDLLILGEGWFST